MQRRHAPLFELDEHNNYRAIPFTDPIYHTAPPPHQQQHQHQHSTPTTSTLPTGLQLLLSDLQRLSWRTVSDWVVKPFISGLAFGMGSYASRYIVHALMVRYSDYHVPADMGGSTGGEVGHNSTAAGAAGDGTAAVAGDGGAGEAGGAAGGAAAVEGTPSVVAEAVAHQMGEQITGGSQSLAMDPSHHKL